MTQIKWENVPEKDIRAEAEVALEASGELKKIRSSISQNPAIESWRRELRETTKKIINEMQIDHLDPDILYDCIAARSLDTLPKEINDEIIKRIQTFLGSQFEDHA